MKKFKNLVTILSVMLILTGLSMLPSENAFAYTTFDSTNTAYVTTATVNVRSGAGTSYSSYGTLPDNTAICPGLIEGTSGSWTKIQLYSSSSSSTTYGYISSSYLTKTTTNRRYTATSNVNVRTGAGTSYSEVYTVSAGNTQILFYGYKVSANGYSWVPVFECTKKTTVGSSSYYITSFGWTAIAFYS